MYLFGPVPSRRLGLSLGVDLLNCKSCNLNCVYCELGRTFKYEDKRRVFVKTADVLKELNEYFGSGGAADFVTFSGAGEPTLAENLGEAIAAAKRETGRKAALITNAVLFSDAQVRKEAALADVVLPSVDAASEETFKKLNRPHASISLENYLDGLRKFSAEYRGGLWVEVMLVKGMNDNETELEKLAAYLGSLDNVEKIQVNTVVRARAEETADPVDEQTMARAVKILGPKAEAIGSFSGGKIQTINNVRDAAFSIIKLRPVTAEDISAVLPVSAKEALSILEGLVGEGRAEKLKLDNRDFYRGKA